MAKLAKHSFKDTRGALWVACSECERGANGSADCACGANAGKRFCNLGCFSGKLLPDLKLKEEKKEC